MRDFLLFALFFIIGGIGLMVVTLSGVYETLFLEQLRTWTITTSTFLLFIHTSKIRWVKTPKIIWFTGIIWYSVIMVLTLFYEIFEQPDKARVLIFGELPHGFSGTFPFGAGVRINGDIIIYSTTYSHIWLGFLIFTLSLAIYSYIKTEAFNPTKRIILARRLWIVAWFSYLLYAVIALRIVESMDVLGDMSNVFILISIIVIGYISFRLPEAMLITQAQIINASELYKRIMALDNDHSRVEFGMDELVKYVQSISKEVLIVDS
jgi:hypothetical protein